MASAPHRMEQSELKSIFNSLKPKQSISVWFDSAFKSADSWTELQVGRKSKSKKYNLEKISLITPQGSKFYLYNRQGKISLAMGDMGTILIAIKTHGKNAESFNADEKRCSYCKTREIDDSFKGSMYEEFCLKCATWLSAESTDFSQKSESFAAEKTDSWHKTTFHEVTTDMPWGKEGLYRYGAFADSPAGEIKVKILSITKLRAKSHLHPLKISSITVENDDGGRWVDNLADFLKDYKPKGGEYGEGLNSNLYPISYTDTKNYNFEAESFSPILKQEFIEISESGRHL